MPRASAAGHNRAGAGAQARILVERAQPLHRRGDIERLIVHRGQAQFAAGFQRRAAQRFVVDIRWQLCRRRLRSIRACGQNHNRCRPAFAAPAPRAPECAPGRCRGAAVRKTRRARRSLQRCSIIDGNHAFSRSLKPGSSSEERLSTPQIDPGFQHGEVRPDVRSTQRLHFPNFHILANFSAQISAAKPGGVVGLRTAIRPSVLDSKLSMSLLLQITNSSFV